MDDITKLEQKPEIRVITPFWNRPWVRFMFVFLFGFCAGLVAFSLLRPGTEAEPVPLGEMKGTLYDSRSYDQMKTADNLYYESAQAKATFAVRYSTKIVEARINVSSLYPVKATMQFDFNNFEVLNVQNVSVNDQSSAVSASNYVQFNNTGDNQFIVQLYNKNSLSQTIGFNIYQNDMPIYQNAVTVNKE
jgi:hypothetical protein